MTGGSGSSLRIASYNTRDFLDDRRAAARVVRAIGPDILCLQEVPRWPLTAHRVRTFADECGMRWPRPHRGSGGTTIFVSDRITVDSAAHRRLSVALPMRTRGYALARLRHAGGSPIAVASIHLSLRAGERHAHTRQILRSLEDLAGDSGRIIVAGDLNELDTGPVWGLLCSRVVAVSPDAPTYPVRKPRARIDVIFASPELERLDHEEIVLDEADVLAASDHRPIWADLAW